MGEDDNSVGDEVESSSCITPPSEFRCTTHAGSGWRCREWRFEDKKYCKKHYCRRRETSKSSSGKKRKRTEQPMENEVVDENLPHHMGTARLMFITGKIVEVSLPDKHCTGAWFPATILKEIENELFYVEYNGLSLNGIAEYIKDTVDILHIRPPPPENLEGKEFDVLEEVDAFFDFGWWSGVITKVFAANRYIVQFKHQKEQRELNQFQIRSHMEWINREWVHNFQETNKEKRGAKKRATTSWKPTRQSKYMVSKTPKVVSSGKQLASESNLEITSTEASMKGREVHKSLHMAECAMSLKESASDKDQCYQAVEDGGNDINMQVFVDNTDDDAMESGKLSFIKSYPMWEIFKSMEVFRSLPQKPHFQPLQKMNKLLREGQAIGYMLCFADIVAKISKVKFDEHESSLENKLEVLIDLEAVGFNVQLIRARSVELLRMKASVVQLDGELKQVETNIIKENHQVNELDEKIRELQESITKLKKRREMILIEASLKKRQKIEDEIQEFRLDFNRIAASPW